MSQTRAAVITATLLLWAAPALAAGVQEDGTRDASDSLSGLDFDYFYFVRQYAPTYCNKHRCHSTPDDFTVHGLWPNDNDGHWPEFCEHVGFNETLVADLLPELERYWPSWNTSEDFWAHEWTKHGTCAAKVLGYSEHDYFSTGLHLHQAHDIKSALARGGIVPSIEKVYNVERVHQTLIDAFGAAPLIHCDPDGITEVWMCFTKSLELFDCAPNHHYACEHMRYPPVEREHSLTAIST